MSSTISSTFSFLNCLFLSWQRVLLLQLSKSFFFFVPSDTSFVITACCVIPRGHGKAQLHSAWHLSCCHTSGISNKRNEIKEVYVAGLMFLIAYRVPKRLEDSLIFQHVWNKTHLCAHPSKPYVFLSLFSEYDVYDVYDLEDADQCVVCIEHWQEKWHRSGLWSAEPNSCSTLICLQHIKRAVDIKMCSVRDGLKG